jgi:hypothetical protein
MKKLLLIALIASTTINDSNAVDIGTFTKILGAISVGELLSIPDSCDPVEAHHKQKYIALDKKTEDYTEHQLYFNCPANGTERLKRIGKSMLYFTSSYVAFELIHQYTQHYYPHDVDLNTAWYVNKVITPLCIYGGTRLGQKSADRLRLYFKSEKDSKGKTIAYRRPEADSLVKEKQIKLTRHINRQNETYDKKVASELERKAHEDTYLAYRLLEGNNNVALKAAMEASPARLQQESGQAFVASYNHIMDNFISKNND